MRRIVNVIHTGAYSVEREEFIFGRSYKGLNAVGFVGCIPTHRMCLLAGQHRKSFSSLTFALSIKQILSYSHKLGTHSFSMRRLQ